MYIDAMKTVSADVIMSTTSSGSFSVGAICNDWDAICGFVQGYGSSWRTLIYFGQFL
jgi:hypothetical protein